MSLLNFQEKHSKELINSLDINNIAISCADTGTGKTYITIHIAKLLKLKPFVICPKSIIYNWINVMKIFDVEYYGISNYESIKNYSYYNYNKNKIGEKIKCPYINKNYKWDLPDDCLLIFDEAHKCKNHKTINSQLLLTHDIENIKYKIILLSATLSDTLKNFRVFAVLLKFCPNMNLFKSFSRKYNNDFILIHKLLFPTYGGRLKLNEIKELPDNIILPEKYYMKNAAEIQKQYEYINEIVENKKKNIQNTTLMLPRMIFARQKIEALKVETIIELINDHLDNGFSVAVFVNFLETIGLIENEIPIKCKIIGDQTLEERNNAIELFQTNKEKIIIATLQSGGVGISLHDLDGNYPRVSIISPSWSAQDLMQALGRVYRVGGKSKVIQKIVYCADTIEEDIANIIQKKFDNYSSLNDGIEKSNIIL